MPAIRRTNRYKRPCKQN